MTQVKGKAKRKPPASGAGGKNGKPESIEWQGLTLELPSTLPLSVAFDLAGTGGPFADIRFLSSVLGPDQVSIVRDKLDADGAVLNPEGTEVLGQLIESIFASYGFKTGEATASSDS